jgi:DNA-binding phage protein
MENLLSQLAHIAKDRGYTQAELAESVGLHPVALSRAVVSGKCKLSTVESVAAFLKMRLVLVPDNALAEGITKGNLF